MTYGFALLTVGTVFVMSGYNNVPVAQILKGAFQTKKGEGPGSGFVSLILESAKAPAEGGKEATTPGGATNPNAAGAVAKAAAEASALTAHHYPYSWGGGHEKLGVAGGVGEHGGPGFDCSGAVSAVLGAAGLLSTPLDSTGLMSYGAPGPGKFITIWANPEHTFMKINGVWFGTGSARKAFRGGPAWGNSDSGNLGAYTVRHPKGF